MIRIKMNAIAKEDVAKGFSCFNNAEQFLFHDGAVALCRVEFARVKSDGEHAIR